jgi:crossover junction endodeoxyribonuclease RusA
MKQHHITLPWPLKELSPNARCHWTTKARAVKRYRADCHNITLAEGIRKIKADRVDVNIIITVPNAKWNRDNAIASFKAGQDGVADAIGIPDERWSVTYAFLPPESPGKIELTIREA